jgi:hypothetical protein
VECLEVVLAQTAGEALRAHWMDDDGECTRVLARSTPGRQLDEVLRLLAGGGWLTRCSDGAELPVLAVTVSAGNALCWRHEMERWAAELAQRQRPPRQRRRLALGRSA